MKRGGGRARGGQGEGEREKRGRDLLQVVLYTWDIYIIYIYIYISLSHIITLYIDTYVHHMFRRNTSNQRICEMSMLSSLSLMQSLEQRHHRYRAAATALSPTVLHLDRSRCAVCLHKTLWNSIAGMKR